MKIGIFGGAFNPIHNGHLALARHYSEYLGLDKLIFVPTCLPPHKTNEGLASGEDRIKMLELALEDKNCEISDLEFQREGKSYTFFTLRELMSKYEDAEFYLIIGSDQYFYFPNWFRAGDILKMVTVVTAAREKDEYERLLEFRRNNECMKNTIISNFDVLEVSSSQIRDMLKNGKDISEFVPSEIFEYIKERRLYV